MFLDAFVCPHVYFYVFAIAPKIMKQNVLNIVCG